MRSFIVASVAALMLAGSAAAQTPAAPAAPAPAKASHAKKAMAPAGAMTAAAPKGRKASSPAGVECSKQADAKSLHGKDREKFRRACMKAAKA